METPSPKRNPSTAPAILTPSSSGDRTREEDGAYNIIDALTTTPYYGAPETTPSLPRYSEIGGVNEGANIHRIILPNLFHHNNAIHLRNGAAEVRLLLTDARPCNQVTGTSISSHDTNTLEATEDTTAILPQVCVSPWRGKEEGTEVADRSAKGPPTSIKMASDVTNNLENQQQRNVTIQNHHCRLREIVCMSRALVRLFLTYIIDHFMYEVILWWETGSRLHSTNKLPPAQSGNGAL